MKTSDEAPIITQDDLHHARFRVGLKDAPHKQQELPELDQMPNNKATLAIKP